MPMSIDQNAINEVLESWKKIEATLDDIKREAKLLDLEPVDFYRWADPKGTRDRDENPFNKAELYQWTLVAKELSPLLSSVDAEQDPYQ